MLEMLRNIVQEVNIAEDLDSALKIIVQRIREAIGADVCSVYMRDQRSGRYVFQANEGLNREQLGRLSLAAGEGLVGMVAEREEPLNLDLATSHANFHPVEGIGEEPFNAFLGVPIIHQREVLGVLVVQQKEQRRFDESEESFLVTISAQLAGVIAHARVTGSINFDTVGSRPPDSSKVRGIAGAPGIAIGEAVVVSPVADLYAVPDYKTSDRRSELRAFKKALIAVRADIEMVAEKLGEQLNPEEHALFDVYLRILDDATIGTEVASRIKAGQWAQGALSQVMIEHIQHFERMEQSYLRERAVDVKDLGTRVLAYLQAADPRQQSYPDSSILVGEELTASILGEIPREKLAGIISITGSGNSHVAILARAMGVPTVMGAGDLPYTRLQGREVIIDGYYGEVYLNPDAALKERFAAALAQGEEVSQDLESLRGEVCETLDGHRLSLWVNTGLVEDVEHALDQGAEGVGLYRTEVTFQRLDRFPSEEEQRKIYRSQLQAFAPLPVTMRTLDIGGDKALPYFPIKEDNPFLGWRGIRVTLDHPEILLVQTRAMIKASAGLDNLRIMLPMVSNLSELEEALEFIRRAHREVVDEGSEVSMPPVGVMVEVPAAVYQARELARLADFLSVGSNDLTQYLLAVDRNNSRVADLYHAFHPAVLQALRQVAEAARAEGRQVSLCGELAGDPAATVLLLGMGFNALSMNANSLARVKKAVRSLSLSEAAPVLEEVMNLGNSQAVHQRLQTFLSDKGLSGFFHAPLD